MNSIKSIRFATALCIGLFVASCQQDTQETSPPTRVEGILVKNGAVVSAHPLASEIGLAILKKGGNAFDAAIAVQYALAVVLPKAGNIGGGGFMVARAANGEKYALDFREKAPSRADRDMFLDENGEPIPSLSVKGHKAAGVPGTVAGMQEVHQKLGSLPFAELIQPAIDLAANGFLLTEYEAGLLNRFQSEFLDVNLDTIFLVRNTPYEAGETIQYTELAQTLTRIRDQGADGFYKGETARLIVEEMERGGGLISLTDLEGYYAKWRTPLEARFKGQYTVISMPPSSSGGVALLQLLKGSELFDFKGMGHNTPAALHHYTELFRRVYADRSSYLGDMDYYSVPLQMLLDSAYIVGRMQDINPQRATPSSEIKEGEVERIESFETTHFSIVDAQGNAVAITTTLNSYFGCKVLVKGAGFFLNNEMDDFSIKPGMPNQFGLVGSEANSIQPGKRMLSSMTPTIVEKNDSLFMVVGTPGGSTIITNVYQVVMNVLEYDMTMQEAVNAKKIHAQWLPDVLVVEKPLLDSASAQTLRALGHTVTEIDQIGRIEAILIRPDGTREGAADNTRTGDATAVGY